MTLDVSQLAVIIASGAVTVIATFIGFQLRRHTLKQEKAAARREAKQELHYRKLDAVIFALASAADNISGVTFKRAYDEKMLEFKRENELIDGLQ
jgi:hypothetical protein